MKPVDIETPIKVVVEQIRMARDRLNYLISCAAEHGVHAEITVPNGRYYASSGLTYATVTVELERREKL